MFKNFFYKQNKQILIKAVGRKFKKHQNNAMKR